MLKAALVVFRAVFGKNFYGEMNGESFGALRSSMLIETVVLICLYFVRSYYPNLLIGSLGDSELHGNKQVLVPTCTTSTCSFSVLHS